MRVTLSLTHRCNLACRYCYGGRASKDDMSKATALAVVDFIVGGCRPGADLQVQFFGGEPLLCADLVREIVPYLRGQTAHKGIRLALSVTTNGTLLDRPILEFLREQDIDLCVSVDGPAAVHDLNRRFPNGKGSFSVVEPKLCDALATLASVQVNTVYGPDTIGSLPATVRFLAGIGVPAIHLNPDISAVWPVNFDSQIADAFARIAEDYLAWYTEGREISINVIDSKLALFAKGGYSCEDKCCMGDGELAFAPSGNIYPCERLIGEDRNSPFCIGNVHTGLDAPRRQVVSLGRGNNNQSCRACPWQRYCMNWCGCTNYFMTGRTDLAGSALCAIERAAISAARQVTVSPTFATNQLLARHVAGYFHAEHQSA